VKFATSTSAIKGFDHLQAVHDAGYLNKDFASTKFEAGLAKVAKGEGAHYPMLTFAIGCRAGRSTVDRSGAAWRGGTGPAGEGRWQ
jgi:hypothetical protein